MLEIGPVHHNGNLVLQNFWQISAMQMAKTG
jgi:hypothetical protein